MGDETLSWAAYKMDRAGVLGQAAARLATLVEDMQALDKDARPMKRWTSPFALEAVRIAEHAFMGSEALDQQGDRMAVLVVDPQHPRHKQFGRRVFHDWKEYGVIGTRFADGKHEDIPDGWMKGERKVAEQFYALDDQAGQLFDLLGRGPRHLQVHYFHLGCEHGVFRRDYLVLFGKEPPEFKTEWRL